MAIFTNEIRGTAEMPAITSMSGAKESSIGPPVEYGGQPGTLNPEELFVASINSCLMLVFYHFARNANIKIMSYETRAEGTGEKTREGLRFTHVAVQASIKVEPTITAEKLAELGKLAEKFCLVSNSVSCPVDYSVSLA